MRVVFNACCVATYEGELELPDNINPEDKSMVHSYILDHLDEVPCNDLEYIGDTDEPVLFEDIKYIGE